MSKPSGAHRDAEVVRQIGRLASLTVVLGVVAISALPEGVEGVTVVLVTYLATVTWGLFRQLRQ